MAGQPKGGTQEVVRLKRAQWLGRPYGHLRSGQDLFYKDSGGLFRANISNLHQGVNEEPGLGELSIPLKKSVSR